MKLFEIFDEFENQECSLLDLASKREARSNEIRIFLDFLKNKYPSLSKMNRLSGKGWTYWKILVDDNPDIDQKEKTKLAAKYTRWQDAKKRYENAGGNYCETLFRQKF